MVLPVDELTPVRTFAMEQHANQSYGEGVPYSEHLLAVEVILRTFGATLEKDYELLSAAWLHDIVEDCEVPLRTIQAGFGEEVAKLVWAVTNEPGDNRKERHEKSYPKIRGNTKATRLKLADRISNLLACLGELKRNGTSRLLKMYQKEEAYFREMLYVAGENEDLWQHLDQLFREAPSLG